MLQNYEVRIHQLGQYPQGSVLPRYVLEAAAGGADETVRAAVVAEMVDRGVVKPTTAPVNVKLEAPTPRGAATSAIPESLADEVNQLRQDAKDLRADRDGHKARADAAEVRRDALAAEIAKYVEENSHLRASLAEAGAERDATRARVAEMERAATVRDAELVQARADLESLTAPDTTKKKKTAAA